MLWTRGSKWTEDDTNAVYQVIVHYINWILRVDDRHSNFCKDATYDKISTMSKVEKSMSVPVPMPVQMVMPCQAFRPFFPTQSIN